MDEQTRDSRTAYVPHRDDILRIARRHGVQRVALFGSVARGEATESSDVDLLVTMEDGRSLFDLIAFKLDVEALLGRNVDVVSRDGISPYLADYIFAEEIPL